MISAKNLKRMPEENRREAARIKANLGRRVAELRRHLGALYAKARNQNVLGEANTVANDTK